jgi:hypothetical protein
MTLTQVIKNKVTKKGLRYFTILTLKWILFPLDFILKKDIYNLLAEQMFL